MLLLAVVVATTLSVSALCSLFEATLYSTRTAALEAARSHNTKGDKARLFLALKHDISAPTSAILILNTLANTAGASIAGMMAASIWGPGWMPLFSALLTLGILFLSEILPKTLGAVHWRSLWPIQARPLTWVLAALRPAVWVTQHLSQLIVAKQQGPSTGEDEILAMIRMGANAGGISDTKVDLLEAVFEFESAMCRDAMVPRINVDWIDRSATVDQAIKLAEITKHTRYPVVDGSLDQPVGVLHLKDLVTMGLDSQQPIAPFVRKVTSVPETMPIASLLRQMQASKRHLAVVIDEHGGAAGIVTLENIIEQLVGSVQDEFDDEEPEIIPGGDKASLIQGGIPLVRLNRNLGLSLQSASGVDTLAGLIAEELQKTPIVGDKVDFGEVQAEVMAVTDHRATRVLLKIK